MSILGGRNRHDALTSHFGDLPATRVTVSSDIGAILTGTDLMNALRLLDEELTALETGHRLRRSVLTVDAVLSALYFHITSDAVVKRTASGTFTVDALKMALRSGSMTADAYLQEAGVFSLPFNAVILANRVASLSVDAVNFRTTAAALLVDALLIIHRTGSLTVDSVLFKNIAAALSVDARIFDGTFQLPVDASIQTTTIIRPGSDIASSGETRSSGTDNWSLVDEVTLDTSDWVDNKVAASYFIVQCTNPSLTGHYITKINLQWNGLNGAPANAGSTLVRDPATGTRYDVTSIPQNPSGGTVNGDLSTRPWDGQPWTGADIDTLQIGARTHPSSLTKLRTYRLFVTVTHQ